MLYKAFALGHWNCFFVPFFCFLFMEVVSENEQLLITMTSLESIHLKTTTPELVAKNSDSPFSKRFANLGTFFRDFITVPIAENGKV